LLHEPAADNGLVQGGRNPGAESEAGRIVIVRRYAVGAWHGIREFRTKIEAWKTKGFSGA
jgi:hypothetical protein